MDVRSFVSGRPAKQRSVRCGATCSRESTTSLCHKQNNDISASNIKEREQVVTETVPEVLEPIVAEHKRMQMRLETLPL